MSVFLKLYNPNDTYVTPSGELANGEYVAKNYPAAKNFKFVVHTDESGEMMIGFYNLSAMLSRYEIRASNNTDESISMLTEAMNREEEETNGDPTESTPEERIAAALELSNLINLPDVNNDDPDE